MASGYEKLGAQEMFGGDYTVIERQAIPLHDQATRFSGKRGDKQDGKGNGLGVGEPGGPMNTLTSGDRHAVVYGIDHAITTGGNCTAQGPCVYDDVEATLKATGVHAVAYAMQSFGDYKDCGVASGLKSPGQSRRRRRACCR